MGRINAEWHRANRMPKSPTLDQRIAWHVEHATHCACRPVSPKLAEEMRRRGIPVPVAAGRPAQRTGS